MRHGSLHLNVLKISEKSGMCEGNVKREILVQKIKVEK